MKDSSKKLHYTFSPEVKAAAKAEGIPRAELEAMLASSAKITHRLGNRRYHDYIFEVRDDGYVLSLSDMPKEAVVRRPAKQAHSAPEPLPPLTNDEFVVYDDCEECGGEGCQLCNSTGQVKRIRKAKKPLFIR